MVSRKCRPFTSILMHFVQILLFSKQLSKRTLASKCYWRTQSIIVDLWRLQFNIIFHICFYSPRVKSYCRRVSGTLSSHAFQCEFSAPHQALRCFRIYSKFDPSSLCWMNESSIASNVKCKCCFSLNCFRYCWAVTDDGHMKCLEY